VALTVAFIAAVLLAASPWPDDHDGVNFLLGVDRFDPARHRPHFPGYPVYIALGKFFAPLAGSAERALIAVSALSAAGCVALVYAIARNVSGARGALAIALLLASHPVFFAFSGKMYSEPAALAMLLLATAALGARGAATRHRFISGAAMGLTLGVRLSWWPYAAAFALYAVARGGWRAFGAGMAAGVGLWLVPLAAYVGPKELVDIGIAFTAGHFSMWGGAIGSAAAPDARITIFAAGIARTAGFYDNHWASGAAWPALAAAGAAYLAWRREKLDRRITLYLAATGFYLAWVFAAQNLEKTRHFIPLIPALALAVAPLAKARPVWVGAVALALAAMTAAAHLDRSPDTPPAVRFSVWLDAQSAADTVAYCGDTERFFDRYLSAVTVRGAASPHELYEKTMSELGAQTRRLVCGDIPGLAFTGPPLIVFPPRAGDPVDKPLAVYPLAAVRF